MPEAIRIRPARHLLQSGIVAVSSVPSAIGCLALAPVARAAGEAGSQCPDVLARDAGKALSCIPGSCRWWCTPGASDGARRPACGRLTAPGPEALASLQPDAACVLLDGPALSDEDVRRNLAAVLIAVQTGPPGSRNRRICSPVMSASFSSTAVGAWRGGGCERRAANGRALWAAIEPTGEDGCPPMEGRLTA